MPISGGLFVLIFTALVERSSTPIIWGCIPNGFLEFEPFVDAEDPGLLCFYILYYSPRNLVNSNDMKSSGANDL